MPTSMRRFAAAAALAAILSSSVPALAAGDLLVAPTRVVLDGPRGTEVILNNIGDAPATYRISLELRRMREDGSLEEVVVEGANATEKSALEMISYAPRRVILPPNQPQAIRIFARAPAGLPDGEYRAHMLFRAVPDAVPVAAPANTQGLSIALTPIYGVTIPIIVRRGSLSVTAAIADARLVDHDGGKALSFSLSRQGARSVHGEIRVLKPGQSEPAYAVKGVAVYSELGKRTVRLSLPAEVAAKLAGPATIQYLEDASLGGRLITEAKVELR